jgi:hypothetical protein
MDFSDWGAARLSGAGCGELIIDAPKIGCIAEKPLKPKLKAD